MKKALPLFLFYILFISIGKAQAPLSSTEKKINDELCACMDKVDLKTITNKASAEKAFLDCFATKTSLLIQLAEEKNIQVSDQSAMRSLGEEVGKNLFKQNCQSFINLSLAMAKGETGSTIGATEGKLKRIETKDFNYFIITDTNNQEKSFIWLRQFPESEKFKSSASFLNKNLKIKWQEIEVYIPAAKNYYKLKEVIGIEIL